ncbi:hypothetical protein FS749_003623 [Ceratobasidium sp. UAMH 11750]|nr:hypothetical protein FS749_003623 [Ceratobasidium sp. UAMH 11750]
MRIANKLTEEADFGTKLKNLISLPAAVGGAPSSVNLLGTAHVFSGATSRFGQTTSGTPWLFYIIFKHMGRGNRQHTSKPVDPNPPDPLDESVETPPGLPALPPPERNSQPLRARLIDWLYKKLPFVSRTSPPLPIPAPGARRGAQPATLASVDPVYQSIQPAQHPDVERDPRGPSCQASVGAALALSAPLPRVGSPALTTAVSAEVFPQEPSASPDQPSTAPNASRGAQPSVAASTGRVDPLDLGAKLSTTGLAITELAIATRYGLGTFIHVPRQSAIPSYNTNSIHFDESDDSSDSNDSGTRASGGRQGLRYRCIGRDVRMVLDCLYQRGFRERQTSRSRSALAQPRDLGNEVGIYLSRPPNTTSHIRILILSGHNTGTKLVINGGVMLDWRQLRRALRTVPPGIVTVVVLACCRAGDVLQDLVEIPNTVLMAACAADEVAVADRYYGDYFLHSLFEVLDAEEGFDEWKDFQDLLESELKKLTETQGLYIMTGIAQEPSDVFRALMKPSHTTPRGRRSAVAQG